MTMESETVLVKKAKTEVSKSHSNLHEIAGSLLMDHPIASNGNNNHIESDDSNSTNPLGQSKTQDPLCKLPETVLGNIFRMLRGPRLVWRASGPRGMHVGHIVANDWVSIKLTCRRFRQIADHFLTPPLDMCPLSWASKNGMIESVRFLVTYPEVDKTEKNNTPILAACMNGHAAVVRILLASGVDPNAQAKSPIRLAAEYGHSEVVQALLSNPLTDPNPGLAYAIEKGFKEIALNIIRSSNFNVKTDNCAALRYVARIGDAELLQQLIEVPGADVSVNCNEVLRWCCVHGGEKFTSIVAKLLTERSKK